MKEGRLLFVFVGLMAGFFVLLISMFFLSTNMEYADMARRQSEAVITLSQGRGDIYDCNFMPLTGVESSDYALAVTGDTAYEEYFRVMDSEDIAQAYALYDQKTPYIIEVSERDDENPFEFTAPSRYVDNQTAAQIIGYLDNSGSGAQGIEKAYDDLLSAGGTRQDIEYGKSALGEILASTEPNVQSSDGTGQGIVLTIDSTIQRVCEGIAAQHLDRGAIVVMEVQTGRIKAAVSVPQLYPNDILRNIEDNDTAFINRTATAFNVGSVIKPLIAATLMEQGHDPDATYSCHGFIDVSDQTYSCFNGIAHGEIDMYDALSESCNGYFINYGIELSPEVLHQKAQEVGLGTEIMSDDFVVSEAGILPSIAELSNIGERASYSFGQGLFTATPIQITAMINTFANAGAYISPSLVEGVYNGYTDEMTESFYDPVIRRVFSENTAREVIAGMEMSVTEGSSDEAATLFGAVAGKSGTAETGRTLIEATDENGDPLDETVGWFSGFYPADDPKYTITVMQDGQNTMGEQMAEVFSQVCDTLRYHDSELPQGEVPVV